MVQVAWKNQIKALLKNLSEAAQECAAKEESNGGTATTAAMTDALLIALDQHLRAADRG